ncbi:MAG: biopolymer transporter ExbD [Nitrospirota bacterium]
MEEKEFDYINVIPLVDVMLVLLTIVLMTSTFIATGIIPVELPRASKSHEETLKTQTIEIDKNGNIYLMRGGNCVSPTDPREQSPPCVPISLEGLQDSIKDTDKNIPVLIRADRDIALQIFVDVLDVVKSLEFKRVSLQTEEER